MRADPISSKKQMPSDVVPRQMLVLLLELLRSNKLSNEAIAGAWTACAICMQGRPGVGATATELGVFNLAAAHLRGIPSPAEMVTLSRGKSQLCFSLLWAVQETTKSFHGLAERADLTACVASGIFDMCTEVVSAVSSAGEGGLQDINHSVLGYALRIVMACQAQPGCEAKIRSTAGALAFCLEHDLDCAKEIGATTGTYAASICCAVFGRDENSEFTFTPQHIELLTESWSQNVSKVGWRVHSKPTADAIYAAQLCVSDRHKPLLTANPHFVPYLVDALLLNPDHPRADMKEELKVWCQQHHCEALAQLAVHEESRQALLRNGSVAPALEMVVKMGLSDTTREIAAAALSALNGKELEMSTDGQKHVMLSCALAVMQICKHGFHAYGTVG